MGAIGRRRPRGPQKGVVDDGLAADALDDSKRREVSLRPAPQEVLQIVCTGMWRQPHCRLAPFGVCTPLHSDWLHSRLLRHARCVWIPRHNLGVAVKCASGNCWTADDCKEILPRGCGPTAAGGSQPRPGCLRLFADRPEAADRPRQVEPRQGASSAPCCRLTTAFT